jgi:hypothetical protein
MVYVSVIAWNAALPHDHGRALSAISSAGPASPYALGLVKQFALEFAEGRSFSNKTHGGQFGGRRAKMCTVETTPDSAAAAREKSGAETQGSASWPIATA